MNIISTFTSKTSRYLALSISLVLLASSASAMHKQPASKTQATPHSAHRPKNAPRVRKPQIKKTLLQMNFENMKTAQLPGRLKVQETRPDKKQARWKIVADKQAPSGNKVLSLVDSRGHSGETFNLCWTDKVKFLDGSLHVRFKANAGKEDQGGGLMWRVQDKDNYYIARYNPLEDNFRLYVVKDAQRRQLASADIHLSAGQWHSMTVSMRGAKFSAALDGKKLLQGSDKTFARAGGVGLWTKADAETSFDDLVVTGP